MFPLLVLSWVQQAASGLLSDELWSLGDGRTLRERRFLEPATGRIGAFGWLSDGRRVSPAALRTEAHRAGVEARAGVSRDLALVLARSQAQEVVPVAFWLRIVEPSDFRSSVIRTGDAESGRQAAYAAAVVRFAAGNAALAGRLRAAGAGDVGAADAWPVVFASLPAAAVPIWAADPAVDQAYYAYPEWLPEQEPSQTTMRTPTVWERGIACASASACKVLVNDVGDVITTNPYLPPVTILVAMGVDEHSTAVAGNIVFDHPDVRAAAAGLPGLYSGAGSSDASAPVVWSHALQQGVSMGNCSWWNQHKGSIAFLDRFFDYTVRQFGVSVFKSNGNQGRSSEPYVTSPGCGYNVISVGAFNDGEDADWFGDGMANYSSYWDPIEGHEKPELVTAGDDVTSAGTYAPNWTRDHFAGTSSASPLACGVAALLSEREPLLLAHPELVKAVLMVSAWQNLEGESLLSEYDGAGGVVAAAADAVLRDRQFALEVLNPSSFRADVFDVSFPALAGDKTRVIALWMSNPDSAFTTDFLDMDLDAAVLDPLGQTVAAAANSKNPYELLQFVPDTTGIYTLRLSRQRFNGQEEPLCVAWSSNLDMAVARVGVLLEPRVGRDFTLLFEDPYDGDLAYQAHLSLATLPSAVPIAPGFVLPLAADALYVASAGWNDFSGVLGPLGRASATTHVPAWPGLVGRSFYAAFYTTRSGSIRSMSEATVLTVLP